MADEVDGRGDLLADGALGQLKAGHEGHGFEAGDDVAGELAWRVVSDPSCPVFMA